MDGRARGRNLRCIDEAPRMTPQRGPQFLPMHMCAGEAHRSPHHLPWFVSRASTESARSEVENPIPCVWVTPYARLESSPLLPRSFFATLAPSQLSQAIQYVVNVGEKGPGKACRLGPLLGCAPSRTFRGYTNRRQNHNSCSTGRCDRHTLC